MELKIDLIVQNSDITFDSEIETVSKWNIENTSNQIYYIKGYLETNKGSLDFSKCYIGSEYKTDYKIISEWNDFLVTGYSHYNIYLKSSFENDRVFGEYITDINYKWRVFYILDDLYHRVGSDRFTVYIISNNSKVKLFYNQKSLPSDYTEYVNTLYKNGEVLFWSGFIDSSMITMVDYYG